MTDLRRGLFDYLGIDLPDHELLTDEQLVENLEAIDNGLWRPGKFTAMLEERRVLLQEAFRRAEFGESPALTKMLRRRSRPR